MAIKINWKTIYNELPENTAEALRKARLNPEQLAEKTDGEILSIEGLNDTALEAIRAQYPAKITETEEKPIVKTKDEKTKPAKKSAPKKIRHRSKRYQNNLKKIDKNKIYPLKDALETLVQVSNHHKLKTLELHLNLTESNIRGEVKLPHSTGKEVRIEIFSNPTIAKLNANQIDFDILLASPTDMPKLARFAKILGPKGLMPNPKNGTISENPEKRAEELKKGATVNYKSEAKLPLLHLSVGKINQDTNDLTENISVLLNTIGLKKIKSVFFKTTHSPSLRLDLSSI